MLPLLSGDRRVICLEDDGSGLYTPQALWTQAREGLKVTTLVFANRARMASYDDALAAADATGGTPDVALVRRMQTAGATAAAEGQEGARDPNVQRLEQELAEKLGAKVAIQHSTAGKGKLVVTYNSLDELDGILAHIQ